MDIERYNRHIILNEIGIEGQEKINKSKVLLVGAGGLGSVISLYLTAAGIGNLGIIDNDVVSLTNLQRQILYRENMIGMPKVECAKSTLEQLNSTIKLDIYNTKLDPSNALEIISKYDIVVDGTDNFDSRLLINDSCVELGKPYVYGAICEFNGQASVFNYNSKTNYRCLYSASHNSAKTQPKGVFGVLPCIIGGIEANEVIKIITGIGKVLSNKLFTIDLLTMQTNLIDII